MVNYGKSSIFDRPYLSCNDHCDWWVFQEIFIIISQKFFWTILNLLSWNLNTFTKLLEQVCFLFICSFFACCFVIILCINTFHRFVLFHCVKIHWMNLFSFCMFFFQSLYMLMLSTFCASCITSDTKEKTKSFNLTSNAFCCEI